MTTSIEELKNDEVVMVEMTLYDGTELEFSSTGYHFNKLGTCKGVPEPFAEMMHEQKLAYKSIREFYVISFAGKTYHWLRKKPDLIFVERVVKPEDVDED